ncbi:hypothetical protein [Sphingopyxis macrogoltabida]|uniref:Uncharacterized protein n=1 Tax=Sphingopyxis macrogoltabida TaxID=33050 RepID=A0AAC8Z0T1_SPHMC|nr:hypothetical protein [Sphingopyxis macrogoltabida]ALJ12793.1 hypothetical protein LH19_07915 [Sphingopyxis macrogoltabida]AMU89740.1 hypothetical protein ATM17_11925 [Sphingopyxis macrogoltabida]
MKPDSIILFDRLYLGSLVLGALNFIIGWSAISEKLASSPEFAATGFGSGFIIASFVIGMIINLVIWYFISARASKVAKWILVAFFALGLVSILRNLDNPLGPQGLSLGVTFVLTILQGVAIYMLFRPDAAAWFNGKPPVDPGTFS